VCFGITDHDAAGLGMKETLTTKTGGEHRRYRQYEQTRSVTTGAAITPFVNQIVHEQRPDV